MKQRVEVIPVRLANDKVIYVESTIVSSEEDVAFEVLEFENITDTIEGIAASLTSCLQKIKPQKASVEFGLELAVESGKLTSLLVKGTGKANLKITLEWNQQLPTKSSS